MTSTQQEQEQIMYPKAIDLHNGGIYIKYNVLDKDTADDLKEVLNNDVEFPAARGRFMQYEVPRDVRGFANDEKLVYKYSGKKTKPRKFPDSLASVRATMQVQLENVPKLGDTTQKLNFCLVNRYESERDCIGEHSDNEKGKMGVTGYIVSLSIGATRRFVVRENKKTAKAKRKKDPKYKRKRWVIDLPHNSVVIFDPEFNDNYTHEVPRETTHRDTRWNLTFRTIGSSSSNKPYKIT